MKFSNYIKTQLKPVQHISNTFLLSTNALFVLITSRSITTSNRWGFLKLSTLLSGLHLNSIAQYKAKKLLCWNLQTALLHTQSLLCLGKPLVLAMQGTCQAIARSSIPLQDTPTFAAWQHFIDSRAIRLQCFLQRGSRNIYHHSTSQLIWLFTSEGWRFHGSCRKVI